MQHLRKPAIFPAPSGIAGGLALLVWLSAGLGCAAPKSQDRSLDSITEAHNRYPTAVSPAVAQRLLAAAQATATADSSTAQQSPEPDSKPTEPPARQPAEIVNQPYKSTPLQLPEEPAKTIPLQTKKDIPAPLPLAPHQRPLNYPLAVAPPHAKPAAPQAAENGAVQNGAQPAPAADSNSQAGTPAVTTAPADSTTSANAPPANEASVNSDGHSPIATRATYAPEPAMAISPVVEALATLRASEAPGFPPPGVIPVSHAAATPPVPAPSTPSPASYASGGYAPPLIADEPASGSDSSATPPSAGDSAPAGGVAPRLTLAEQQAALITALETEIRDRRAAKADQGEIARLELQLRLVYLLAERPEEAVAAIDALSPPERESCKHLLFGLAAFMADEPPSRAAHRNAKILRSLRDATSELAAGSRLDLRNMAFCEKVEYFGWYTEFPRYEFQPKQQVILYVEVENYAAESKGPQSFETELQGSYQIFDGTGQIVAERQLPLDREVCRNYRRDYFLAYRIYMPDHIAAGNYRLELTIEDLKARGQFQGRKLGQGTIDFSVR